MSGDSSPTSETEAASEAHLHDVSHWINGARVAGKSQQLADMYLPATGRVKARVPLANAEELNSAVEAASAASGMVFTASVEARMSPVPLP